MAKVTKKAQNGDRVTADKKGLYTRLSKYKTNDGDRFYKSTSGDIASTKDMNDFKLRTKSADSVRAADLTPAEIKHYETARRYKAGGKAPKAKMAKGGMLQRADGSYSKRGLWDNIRANKGSGKKPTAQMLKQEKKIKAKTK